VADSISNTLADRNFTVSDYLKFISSTVYLGVQPERGGLGMGVIPDLEGIPDAYLGASRTDEGKEAQVSVGYGDLLRLKTGARQGYEESEPSTFKQISSQMGPGEAYWERVQREKFPDQQIDKFGGSLSIGPLRLSGEERKVTSTPVPQDFRKYFTNPELEERYRILNLEGQYPVGSGILSGSIGREWQKLDLPQNIRQSRRQKVSPPYRTRAGIDWEGNLGPVDLGLHGQYERTRGQKPDVSAYIRGRIPF